MKKLVFVAAVASLSVLFTGCEFGSIPEFGAQGSENGRDWTDLDLPSGTLWATCNLGAASPDAAGDYLPGLGDDKRADNDYVYELSQSDEDVLPLDDDIAAERWGGKWRTPTADQMKELLMHCTFSWLSKDGYKGYVVTGKNGNRIFLPAAGVLSDGQVQNPGRVGQYWTITRDRESSMASFILNFTKYECATASNDWSCRISVRPVLKK
ncbi:MAG: hypothetical protein J6Y77_02550 [Paludibacteraceae bacterium]|nr:hypothetical protein [Paludibacteraceae bacterium]